MLRRWKKENNLTSFGALILALVIFACKEEASTISAEEQAYLADYESPKHKWGFMDTTGILVIRPQYDDVGPFRDGLAAFNMQGKWGYLDIQGNVAIPAQYRSAWCFGDHFARVTPFTGESHYIRRDGSPLIPDGEAAWIASDDFSDGLAKVRVGDTFGYIDTTGTLVVQPLYSRAWNFEKGQAKVEFTEKLGVINRSGQVVVPFEFDHIRLCLPEGKILASAKGLSMVFDLSGEVFFRTDEARITDTDGQRLATQRGRDYFLQDINGNQLAGGRSYAYLVYLGDGHWAARLFDGFSLLDPEGFPLPPGGYDQINRFYDGYAVYGKNGYWGYLDGNGNEVIGHPFGLAWDFKNGFARAAFKEGIGFINRKLELAFYPPPGTLDMRDYSEGLAPVQVAR